MSTKIEKIKARLIEALNPDLLDVIDESAKHYGHPGFTQDGSHFYIKIRSSSFHGCNRVKCHQLIYQALEGMLPDEIHAVRIEIVV